MKRLPRTELIEDPALIHEHQRAALMALNVALGQHYKLRFRPPDRARVVDLGTGLGGLTLRMATRQPHWVVDAVDASRAMLDAAALNLRAAQLERRVELHWARLPADRLKRGAYQVVLSTATLHHLHDPQTLWQAVQRLGAPGTQVLVADYARPSNPTQLEAALQTIAPGASPAVQRDLAQSLQASYIPREVEAQLARATLHGLTVQPLSPFTWLAWGTLGPSA